MQAQEISMLRNSSKVQKKKIVQDKRKLKVDIQPKANKFVTDHKIVTN